MSPVIWKLFARFFTWLMSVELFSLSFQKIAQRVVIKCSTFRSTINPTSPKPLLYMLLFYYNACPCHYFSQRSMLANFIAFRSCSSFSSDYLFSLCYCHMVRSGFYFYMCVFFFLLMKYEHMFAFQQSKAYSKFGIWRLMFYSPGTSSVYFESRHVGRCWQCLYIRILGCLIQIWDFILAILTSFCSDVIPFLLLPLCMWKLAHKPVSFPISIFVLFWMWFRELMTIFLLLILSIVYIIVSSYFCFWQVFLFSLVQFRFHLLLSFFLYLY